MKTINFLMSAIYNGKEYRRAVIYKYDDISIVQECFEDKANIQFKNKDIKTVDLYNYEITTNGNENIRLVYIPELLNLSDEDISNINCVSENLKFSKSDALFTITDEETLSTIKSFLKYL